MLGHLGESLFFGLLGAARGAIHHARHRNDSPAAGPGPGPGPVPWLGHPENLRRASYMEVRVPTSFSWERDGRGRLYQQGYDQYGNPI